MSKHKQIMIITWDAQFSLRAFEAICISSSEITLQHIHSSSGTYETLSTRLNTLFNKIDTIIENLIIFSPYLFPVFNLDLKIPKLPQHEIRNALTFELQRQSPIPFDELVWSYRIILQNEKYFTIRILAIKQDSFNSFLSLLAETNAKIDVLIHPAFLENAQNNLPLEEISQIFEDILFDFTHNLDSYDWKDKIHSFNYNKIKFNHPPYSHIDSSVILAQSIAYNTLIENSLEQITLPLPIPQNLKPARFRFFKFLSVVLLVLNLILIFILCFRYSADARKQYQALKKEKATVLSEMARISNEDAQNKELDEFIKKLSEAEPGNHELPEAFLALSKVLSPQIWLSSFSARGQEIELTLQTRDENNVQTELAKINNLPQFSNLSIKNTRRERDGTIVIFVKLNQEKTKQ